MATVVLANLATYADAVCAIAALRLTTSRTCSCGGRAELDAFEVLFDNASVAGREIVEVARAEDLLSIRVAHPHPAFDDIMRAQEHFP
jgi:hypothetical protein